MKRQTEMLMWSQIGLSSQEWLPRFGISRRPGRTNSPDIVWRGTGSGKFRKALALDSGLADARTNLDRALAKQR